MPHIQATGFYSTPLAESAGSLSGVVQAGSNGVGAMVSPVYFTLTTRGTGAGVAWLYMISSSPQTLTLDGQGFFYDNSSGNTGETQSKLHYVTTLYMKCKSGTSKLRIPHPEYITQIGSVSSGGGGTSGYYYTSSLGYANFPSCNATGWHFPNLQQLMPGDSQLTIPVTLGTLPSTLERLVTPYSPATTGAFTEIPSSLQMLYVYGTSTITGVASDLPDTLKEISINSNTVSLSGTLADLPTSLERFAYGNNTLSGNVSSLPSTVNYFSLGGSNTISGNITGLPSGLTYLNLGGSNTLTGDIANLPSVMYYLNLAGNNTVSGDIANLSSTMDYLTITGANTISGSVANLKSGLLNFTVWGANTISGNIDAIPSTLNSISVYGSNTISGNIGNITGSMQQINISGNNTITGVLNATTKGWTNCYQIYITGSNTISGDIYNLPSGCSSISIQGNCTISDYTSRAWPSPLSYFYCTPVSGGLSSSEVDALLADLATYCLTKNSPGTISLQGANNGRTSASDSAVATLVSRGFNLTLNRTRFEGISPINAGANVTGNLGTV